MEDKGQLREDKGQLEKSRQRKTRKVASYLSKVHISQLDKWGNWKATCFIHN
jgi:hypothetical protein